MLWPIKHADQRANRDAHDEEGRRPDEQLPQKRRHANVIDIDEHHRDQRDLIRGGESYEHGPPLFLYNRDMDCEIALKKARAHPCGLVLCKGGAVFR